MRQLSAIWNTNRGYYGSELYTPDSGFIRSLKAMDPGLFVTWNRVKERWIIYEKGYQSGRDHIVCRVENEDGSFRPLDNRIIESLSKAKWMWDKGVNEFDRMLSEEETSNQLQKERDAYREQEGIGNWYALQMMGIPHFQVPKRYEEVQA